MKVTRITALRFHKILRLIICNLKIDLIGLESHLLSFFLPDLLYSPFVWHFYALQTVLFSLL